MTSRKRWTYADITGASEEEIMFWMNQAATHAREGRPSLDDYAQGAARGVFGLWSYVTGDHRNNVDLARLEALIHRRLDAEPAAG
jgi:hypothetical protein